MAPSRTRDNTQNAEASSSNSSKPKSKRSHHHKHAHRETDLNAVPGVQKVKAALRQTRRLLAKDKLDANVRVETERRQRALEAELQQAEQAKKERAFATKYHKVKFFERQKVTRKLKQTAKALESTSDKSEKKKLSSELEKLRVDLNYILHYPKLKKYISLFPPEVRKGEEPSPEALAETKKTNEEREEVRKWVREQMKSGAFPMEPENEVAPHKGPANQRSQKWPSEGGAKAVGSTTKQVEEAQDDFFGDDNEDEDEDS